MLNKHLGNKNRKKGAKSGYNKIAFLTYATDYLSNQVPKELRPAPLEAGENPCGKTITVKCDEQVNINLSFGQG